MTESKTYPLCLATSTKVMIVGILGVLTLAGAAIPFADTTGDGLPPGLFSVFWFGILGVFSYQVLSVPQTIVRHPEGTLEFKAPLRRRVVAIGDLRAIEPIPNQFGMLRFRHGSGKVNVLSQFDGFHELIADIKSTNPNIEIRGC